jgi:hypothetical protein
MDIDSCDKERESSGEMGAGLAIQHFVARGGELVHLVSDSRVASWIFSWTSKYLAAHHINALACYGKGVFFSTRNGLTQLFDHQQDTDRDTAGTYSGI